VEEHGSEARLTRRTQRLLWLGGLVTVLACGARTTLNAPDAAIEACARPTTCSSDEHECTCASGFYCLERGAECVDPAEACPCQ
jgi:hypothetical protein